MNEHWQKEILNLLLDKYERTAAFQKGELPDRRVLLRFYDSGKTDFSAYDIDDHVVRTAINETVTAMKSEKLVGFEWMRGEQNHIIKRVWLDFSNLDKAYQTINRQSAKLLVTEVIRELEQEIEAVNTDWIVAFYSETKVTFDELSEEEIRDYIDSGEPMDKAGAYGIQGIGGTFVTGIEGDYTNVVGFPMGEFCHLVRTGEIRPGEK